LRSARGPINPAAITAGVIAAVVPAASKNLRREMQFSELAFSLIVRSLPARSGRNVNYGGARPYPSERAAAHRVIDAVRLR
jgi:hypothetical protein